MGFSRVEFDIAFVLVGTSPSESLFLYIINHLQTVFIILVCNNQLLNWIENELIRVLSSVPVVAAVLPDIVVKLNALRDKYMTAPPPTPSDAKV